MARLNEAPMSSDSLETLRKKMLRQNRDLAKSNNVRALRIRELESECALMLSENLELRGRILELEKEVEDNESRRIADHALAIKAKLEAQLTEWGSLLSGLGLEPPMKRHSPQIRKNTQQRMSFSCNRPSPSQRRLRDIARDIEDLGSIAENRPSSRQSLNPEQIRALRFEADSAELEGPSNQVHVEQEPVKIDSSPPPTLSQTETLSPSRKPTDPPMSLISPKATKVANIPVPSPEKKVMEPTRQHKESMTHPGTPIPEQGSALIKTGSKRKYAQHESGNLSSRQSTNENTVPQMATEKMSIREKAGGKTLKELTHMRKGARDKQATGGMARKPLAAKSTNDDISSPKKARKPIIMDEIAASKADLTRSKLVEGRSKPGPKNDSNSKIQALSSAEAEPHLSTFFGSDVTMSMAEPVFMTPSSPEAVDKRDGPRGDTPPPVDITTNGETSRPSRRNRTTVSYAEPNLRDKMRRPTKELFDAVTGEGKYARRASQCDQPSSDEPRIKRESGSGDVLRHIPAINAADANPEPGSIPASPLAEKRSSEDLPSVVSTERPKRHSKAIDYAEDSSMDGDENESGNVDVYEFSSSSPQIDRDENENRARRGRRGGTTTRRRSAAVDSEKGTAAKERTASRRRSMMV